MRNKSNKVTWKMIYTEFKKSHPNLSKEIIYWRPYDYATIEIWFVNHMKMTYDYDTKKVNIIEKGES